jgi:integrase
MLEKYFDTPFVLQRLRSGPSGEHVDSFAGLLEDLGYSWWSARRYLRAAAHLGRFTEVERIAFDSIGQDTLEKFQAHLPSCRCPDSNGGTTGAVVRGATLFVDHLREIGVLQGEKAEGHHQLVESFRCWLQRHRGVAPSTLYRYGQGAADLVESLGSDPSRYDAHTLRQFVLDRARCRGVGSAKSLISALRMFLRYLAIEGACVPGLHLAIPALAGWRLAALPRSMPPDDVARIIAVCESTSLMGKRDRAILLLLARLGLRAGDIVGLRLSDVDWHDGSIVVSGKGRREARLPLPQEVGDAMLEYLAERPEVRSDALFLRLRVPLRALGCGGTVSAIVARRMRQARVSAPSHGAHILRHAAATQMLREGVSLHEIGSVLRHRSRDMSAYYAKVDVDLLKQVAQPWPEVSSC